MKKGMTLVEMLIVMTIIVIIAMMMVGILNPAALMNKAIDAQSKKDLGRMKVAFEEYFNDNGCYPNQERLGDLMNKSNCDSATVFIPWITKWPCDRDGNPFTIQIGNDVNCPKWFKILTKLRNEKDGDIPMTWFVGDGLGLGTTVIVNYGVTSTNIGLTDEMVNPNCLSRGGCVYLRDGHCNSLGKGESCSSPNCYVGDCNADCLVSYCENK